MNVSQLQVAFDSEQDRLVLRIGAGDGAEIRAWFTRRMVKLLWPNLLGIFGKKIALEAPAATPEAQRMLAGMQHEAQVREADFSQPFHTQASNFPLGEQPVLVTRVDLTLLPNKLIMLSMKSPHGASIDVNMNEALFHAFCRLLQQSCNQAAWDMQLQFPGQDAASPPPEGDARVLN